MTKAMLMPLPRSWVDRMSLENHLHLEALRRDGAQMYHLGNLAQTAYLARFLWEAGYGASREGLFDELDEVIALCRRAALDSGLWRVNERAYSVLGEVLTLHDRQLTVAPVFALARANERLRASSADGPRSDPEHRADDDGYVPAGYRQQEELAD